MKVLILAAGYGTRLYPHTRNFPKSLLKIGNKPIIDYLLENIEKLNGISRIIVVTNDRFFKKFSAWKNSLKTKYPIHIINDLTTSPDDKRGAIGDMHFVLSQEGFNENFLVLGGDNIFKGSLVDFMHFAKSKQPSISVGIFDIKNKKEARHYGVVSLNKKKRIVEFSEKPSRPKSSLVAMCLYYFPRKKAQLIEKYLQDPFNSRDTTGSFIDWLVRKDKVYGFKFSDFWFDIGHAHTYRKAEKLFK